MTRQLEQKLEERDTKKRDALIHALDYGIVGALQTQGIELLGLSIKHSAFSCLITLRADIGGNRRVAHVGSDSIVNCFLRVQEDAQRGTLQWSKDKYRPDSA